MTEAPVSREAVELALQDYLAESRRKRTSQFDREALAWLALPPQWTGRLAQQASFPGWSPEFLQAAEKEGLCFRTPASPASQLPWYAAEIGARLAPYLPIGAQAGLLGEVADIDDQHVRATILATLARSLPRPLLPRAAAIADGLDDPAAQTRALLGLAAAEPAAEAAATARRALGVAAQMEDPGDRIETLLLVADQGHLDEDARRELGQAILTVLPELAYESERGSVLARAARYLTPPQLPQALEAALALRAAECRIEALAGITERLPDAQAVALLQDEIAAIPTIDTEIGRGRAAKALARRLADYGAADLAASAALTLADEGAREAALQVVAGSLASAGDPDQAAEVSATVMAYGEAGPDQVISLSTLACRLASGDRSIAAQVAERARQAAADLDATPANARALVSLVTALDRTGLDDVTAADRALQSVGGISAPEDRYQLYRKLLTALPEPLTSLALERALAAAQNIAGPVGRVDALADLAPYLPTDQVETVLAAARSLAGREADFSFWMPEPARTEVLDELARRHGPAFLHQQASRAADGVQRADQPDDPAPPTMARWAELARQGALDPAQAAAWLDRRLAALTEGGESGQALDWTETGKLLVPVLGQELDSVVSVGLRRIELLYRRSLDQGHLRRFLPREEQIEEFWRLLDGDDDAWALHYLGAGGLGKTMLLRQVTARLAPGRGIPTARVDFDHLSPDYPITKPGQLLLELLDELQAFSASSHADSFAYSFRAQVTQLHAPVTQGSNDPLARIHDKQFDEVLRTFRDFVLLLPQPVVFILDTCEELARRRSEGSTLPPVEATFEILERLHQEIPALRVIFAGRRLLARSGRDWAVSAEAGLEGHALLPERKEFLRLHEMRGFSRDEAARYLRAAAPGLPPRMTEAVLARSPAPGDAAPIVWEPPRPHGGEQRYNPFDLNLYAGWAREDPSLRAETIAQGTTDPYIAIRIVRRLGQSDLDRLLPAVTLLGRFDRCMLRGELPGSDEDFESAYRELSSQEWIDYQPDPSLNTTFLEVDRNLRPRLLSYYRGDPDREYLLRQAQDRLGPALGGLVEARPLDEIGIDLADAAMRLLPRADAARLWDQVADKIRARCDWAWADQRTSRLLGEDGAVADPGHPARAAVVASRISSLIHTRAEYNPAPDWHEVAERADASPDPVVREWLTSRAIAGKVAAFRLPGVELPSDDLAAFWELMDKFDAVAERLPAAAAEQLAASVCAALEALVEVAERRRDASLVSDLSLIERWLGHIGSQARPDLLALATIIAARGQALHGRFEAALELAARAERAAAGQPAAPPGRWADFDAPAMTCHRIRLELIRMTAALPLPDDPLRDAPLPEWQRAAEADLGTIDADRLIAAILLRRLAAEEITRLARLEERAARRARRPADGALWCHLAVAPMFTAIALGWCALGQTNNSIELLHTRRRQALAAGDTDTENAALLGTLEISRRMRIAQPVLAKNSGKSADPDQRAAAWALAALTEPPGVRATPPVAELPDACLHDWWRSRPATPDPDGEDARLFRQRARQLAPVRGNRAPFGAISLALDLAEAEIAKSAEPQWPDIDLDELAQSGQITAEQLFRVTLRMLALGHPLIGEREWTAGIGPRRMAKLAMDEGELLALRLPGQAVALLDLAVTWFGDAGDPAGALFAAIAGTLARQRAGLGVRPGLESFLAARYEAMAGLAVTPLPAWAELPGSYLPQPPKQVKQARSAKGSRPPEIPAEPALGGWLPRLVACLAREGPHAGGGALGAVASAQLVVRLGATEESVPTELDPSVLAPRPPHAKPGAARRRRVRVSTSIVTIVTGLAAVAAVVATVGYTGSQLAAASGIATFAGVLAIIGLLLAVLGALVRTNLPRRLAVDHARAWWWARTLAGLRIAPWPGTGEPAAGDLGVVIERWQADPASPLPWRRHEPADVTEAFALPPLRGYERGAAAMPAGLRDPLRVLARRAGSRSVRVSLDVDPALERLPWEALLSHPLLAGEAALPGALDFWRRGEPLAGAGRSRRGRLRPPRCVDVLADSTRRLFAERAGLARTLRFPDLSASAGADVNQAVERAGSRAAADPSDIVLVIGRPVRVRGTVLLQTAEQAAARGTSAEDLREAVVGGGLLEPEVVAGLQARLVIVLGAPAETGGRLDTERRDAADLRGWAADVFRAGAETVISLPSLHPRLAEEVLAAMASRIRGGISPRAVHEAVRAARTRIGTWPPAPPSAGPHGGGGAPAERQAEQALDVCLFRRDWAPPFATYPEGT